MRYMHGLFVGILVMSITLGYVVMAKVSDPHYNSVIGGLLIISAFLIASALIGIGSYMEKKEDDN
jgi:uncharacterized BrkB/YihY/UPF0761 family membrane protein